MFEDYSSCTNTIELTHDLGTGMVILTTLRVSIIITKFLIHIYYVHTKYCQISIHCILSSHDDFVVAFPQLPIN